MKICIPSIRHSGTRLLTKKIFKGWKMAHLNHPEFKGGNYIIAGHVYEPSLDKILEYVEQFPAIVPMRHPARIWKSFSDRDMSYDFYFDHWLNMIRYISLYSPMYVHIDLDDRDKYLSKIENKLGIELKHDWTVDDTVCDKGNAHIEITSKDIRKIPETIMDFYRSTL